MLVLLALAATVATFALQVTGADHVVVFVASAVALAALAALVGEGTEQLGHRFGAGATGVLQSALGNLPELFISIFALQAGLVVVVQTALIGSILANTLIVPIIPLIIALGFAAAALGALWMPLAAPFDIALNGLLTCVIATAQFGDPDALPSIN